MPQTEKKRILSPLSFLVMLMLLLCVFFRMTPAKAETVPPDQPPASGEEEETTTAADPQTGPEEPGESTPEETTGPEAPAYHEEVTIPLSSPFSYGSLTEAAELVIVTGEEPPVNVRGGAGADFPVVGRTRKYQTFRKLGEELSADGRVWFKVLIELEEESFEGYISSLVSRSFTLSAEGDPYAAYLEELGFPASYAYRLSAVHAKYPKWFFLPAQTGLEWADAFAAEANPDSHIGISLVYMTSGPSSFRSMKHDNFDWAANRWKAYDGDSWTLASDELVAYYLDPRNFLSPDNAGIFQFLNLSFDGTQTIEGIRKIVKDSFMEDGKHKYGETFSYPEELFRIGQEIGINPYYLASTILQEVGKAGSGSVSGSYSGNLHSYTGIYNYYNIQSYTHGGMTAVESGLNWASATPSANNNPYDRPWNDRQKALMGGAKFFVFSYIGQGQNTFYYKKFNVTGDKPYTHQYMTNVGGAYSEAVYFGRGYDEAARQAILSFEIPIYANMPGEACPIPTRDGNPNTRLKSLAAGSAELTPALNVNETAYRAAVSTQEITISAETIDAGARVEGTGSFTLSEGENVFTLTVTAQNGDTRDYTLSVYYAEQEDLSGAIGYPQKEGFVTGVEPGTKAEDFVKKLSFGENVEWKLTDASGQEKAASDLMKTGDRILVYAPNGALWSGTAVLIYGDVNGDGMVNISDLIKVRNHILKENQLSGSFMLTGDINQDMNINISDLIKIRNHILGVSAIPQTD